MNLGVFASLSYEPRVCLTSLRAPAVVSPALQLSGGSGHPGLAAADRKSVV